MWLVLGFYILAWLVHRLAPWMAGCLMRLIRFTPRGRQPRPERQATLRGLVVSAISSVAFAAATLASLGQFVPVDTLFWVVGLFSAAFGLGARALTVTCWVASVSSLKTPSPWGRRWKRWALFVSCTV
jgi:hypothetical protein